MNAYDVIMKKRNGHVLSRDEIEFMVSGFVRGAVPDYQMAALLMAIYFRGMAVDELVYLTESMVHSGRTMDLSFIKGKKIDKHSSGGVGDKTSLIVCPLAASCGVPMAKMSGRGLGHTGGTLDKLESIPGFRVDLTPEEYIAAVDNTGLVIAGQTHDLAPADGLLYALRDVTATVDSIPLIASSIMSKKIAGGSDAIVLDVKCGSGAFMKTDDAALELARTMVAIGTGAGKETVALVTGMDEPLGQAVGNAIEVKEAISTLKGEGPEDIRDLCIEITAEIIRLGLGVKIESARETAANALRRGLGIDKFEAMVVAQGGDGRVISDPDRFLPRAACEIEVTSPATGFVERMDAYTVGVTAGSLGAGRKRKGDFIDYAAGVTVLKKAGDCAELGEPMFVVHAASKDLANSVIQRLLSAVTISPERPVRPHILRHRVNRESTFSHAGT